MTQASEVLFEDTDVDILQQITVPPGAAVGDLIAVTDPGGGAPLQLTPQPASGLIGGPYIPYAEKGAASGVATLDSGGKLSLTQVPLIAINNVFDAASEAAMLALTAQTGDMARRTDLANKLYVLAGTGDPTILGNWLEVAAGVVSGGGTRTVTSFTALAVAVGGRATGSLTLAKGTVLWGIKITNAKQARVRIYDTTAARTADLARTIDTSAVSGSYPAGTGIAADAILGLNTGYYIGFDEKAIIGDHTTPSPTTTVYWTVDNLTGSITDFVVELYHTPFEA